MLAVSLNVMLPKKMMITSRPGKSGAIDVTVVLPVNNIIGAVGGIVSAVADATETVASTAFTHSVAGGFFMLLLESQFMRLVE